MEMGECKPGLKKHMMSQVAFLGCPAHLELSVSRVSGWSCRSRRSPLSYHCRYPPRVERRNTRRLIPDVNMTRQFHLSLVETSHVAVSPFPHIICHTSGTFSPIPVCMSPYPASHVRTPRLESTERLTTGYVLHHHRGSGGRGGVGAKLQTHSLPPIGNYKSGTPGSACSPRSSGPVALSAQISV